MTQTIFFQDLHKHLEQKLAQFHEREDCILYASCFDANAGLFEVFHPSVPFWSAWNKQIWSLGQQSFFFVFFYGCPVEIQVQPPPPQKKRGYSLLTFLKTRFIWYVCSTTYSRSARPNPPATRRTLAACVDGRTVFNKWSSQNKEHSGV